MYFYYIFIVFFVSDFVYVEDKRKRCGGVGVRRERERIRWDDISSVD